MSVQTNYLEISLVSVASPETELVRYNVSLRVLISPSFKGYRMGYPLPDCH